MSKAKVYILQKFHATTACFYLLSCFLCPQLVLGVDLGEPGSEQEYCTVPREVHYEPKEVVVDFVFHALSGEEIARTSRAGLYCLAESAVFCPGAAIIVHSNNQEVDEETGTLICALKYSCCYGEGYQDEGPLMVPPPSTPPIPKESVPSDVGLIELTAP